MSRTSRFPLAHLAVDLGSSHYPLGRRAALGRLTTLGWSLIDFEPGDLVRRPVWVGVESGGAGSPDPSRFS